MIFVPIRDARRDTNGVLSLVASDAGLAN